MLSKLGGELFMPVKYVSTGNWDRKPIFAICIRRHSPRMSYVFLFYTENLVFWFMTHRVTS